MTPEIRGSIGEFDQALIDALYGDRAEGYGFVRAWEEASVPGVGHAFIAAGREAISPAFIAPYDWTTFFKSGRRFGRWARPLKMVGLGHIHANELSAVARSAGAFAALVEGLEVLGKRERAAMLLVKDVNDRDVAIADPILRKRGYARVQSPPLAYLHVPGSAEQFLGGLKGSRRRDFLRNVRRSDGVEVVDDADISGMEDELAALAAETRERAGTQFGGLEATPASFFTAIRRHAAENASVALYRLEGKLIGFSLMLHDGQAVYGKTIGLHYPEARETKIYFRNMLNGIETAARRGVEWLCLGQLAYETKLFLGAKVERRWTYIRMRGAYAPGFMLSRPFVEGMRLDPAFAQYDVPEVYFSNDAAGSQPPVHRVFK